MRLDAFETSSCIEIGCQSLEEILPPFTRAFHTSESPFAARDLGLDIVA